jgi:Mg-chelatase subunit ChlD
MSALDSGHCDAVIVPDEPALRGGRIAVWPRAGVNGPAVLNVDGRRGPVTLGVYAEAFSEVPAGVVAVPDVLASRLGLHKDVNWQLAPAPTVPLATLTIEPMVEEPVDDLARAVRQDSGLVGQCLWAGQDVTSNVLELGSRQFRVRAIEPAAPAGLRAIAPTTQVELFISGSRVGLDVVVLADCSGSMEVDDLPLSPERVGGGFGYRTRLDALKEALMQMLHARLRVAGRESRIALIKFAEQPEQRFPAEGGMVPLDANSPGTLIASFEQAVLKLTPWGTTDIAGALLQAAELLDKHGKPGNDRLIVLVSDGRPWTQKSADATGEIVFAVDDPLSLMDHLHRRRDIRLHAIGLSDGTLYDAWLRRGHSDGHGLRPDHPLLQRLVEVGGGDPTRIGGIDVLERYFSGLGSGLTRHIGAPAPAGPARALAEATAALLRQHSEGDPEERARLAVTRIAAAIDEINYYARPLAGTALGPWIPFDITDECRIALEKGSLTLPIRSQREFVPVLGDLHMVMVQRGPGWRNRGEPMPGSIADIFACFRSSTGRISDLRRCYGADSSGGTAAEQRHVEACREVLKHYLQVITIKPDDAARWSALRLHLLQDAASTAEQAVAVARRLAEAAGTQAAPSPPADEPDNRPADFSIDLNLRLRD